MDTSLELRVADLCARVALTLAADPACRDDRRRIEDLLVEVSASGLQLWAERMRAARLNLPADVAALDSALAELEVLRDSLRERLEALASSV